MAELLDKQIGKFLYPTVTFVPFSQILGSAPAKQCGWSEECQRLTSKPYPACVEKAIKPCVLIEQLRLAEVSNRQVLIPEGRPN
jgi:hypothetical protein